VAGSTEEISLNFLRLYEFVSDRLSRGGMADIDSAQRVLRTLLDGFEEARNQAIALEAAGALPTFGAQHTLHLTT
jgi:flagellin-specific chaperone FliS